MAQNYHEKCQIKVPLLKVEMRDSSFGHFL